MESQIVRTADKVPTIVCTVKETAETDEGRAKVDRLAAAGVTRIAIGGQDTYAEGQDYFSYRRACHKGENSYGRQLSVIGLAGG